MRVETHDHLRSPRSTNATRVVIYDRYDNPVAVAIEVSGNTTTVIHAAEPGFREALELLGVRRTVVVDQISAPQIRS